MNAQTWRIVVLLPFLAARSALAQGNNAYLSVGAQPAQILTDGWSEVCATLEGATINPPATATFSVAGITLGTALLLPTESRIPGIGMIPGPDMACLSVYGSQLESGSNTVLVANNAYSLGGETTVTVATRAPGVVFAANRAADGSTRLSWSAPGYNQLQITVGYASSEYSPPPGAPVTGILGSSGTIQVYDYVEQYLLVDLKSNAAIASTTAYDVPGAKSGPAPTLASFSPNAAPSGSGDITLQVNGFNFSPASLVTWNNTSLVTHFESAALLQATVPASLLINQGTALLAVADSGQISTSMPFTITPVGCAVNFTANPNPVISPTGLGVTTLSWNAPCYDQLKITVVSPTGTPMTGGIGSSGTAQTGDWVSDGLQFFLVDTSSNTAIASLAARVCTSACAPALTSLAPGTAPMGTSDLTVQAAGFNFDDTSVVTWNNEQLPTQFVSPTLLQTTVPAELLAWPTSAPVAVATGSQTSTALPFQVSCPYPAPTLAANPNPTFSNPGVGVTTLSWNAPCFPQVQIRIGSATGQNFTGVAGPSGSAQTGPWVDDGMQFFLVDLATGASIADITVYVAEPSSPPVLTSMDPGGVEVGYSGLTLAVAGSGFSPSSMVMWNGADLATQFQGSSNLTATVPDSLLKILGTVPITVSNGLVSKSLPFTVGNTAFLYSDGMNCMSPNLTTACLETDLAAHVWFGFEGAIAGDVAQAQWFGPDGNLFATMTSSVANASLYGGFEFNVPLSGYPAASMPGNWKVAVTWNGHPYFTVPFTIEPGPIEDYDGQWDSAVWQTFSMTVANNHVTAYEYTVSGPDCPNGAHVSSGPSTSIPIVGNSFSSTELTGTFNSATFANLSLNTANIPGCGAGTVVWWATKQ
jgi:hypothetical protein